MPLQVVVEGAEGTYSVGTAETHVQIGAPLMTVEFVTPAETQVEVRGGGIRVNILAPGYAEPAPVQLLNDLADVETAPAQGSVLQYSLAERRWIAGFRLAFRPALGCYLISEP